MLLRPHELQDGGPHIGQIALFSSDAIFALDLRQAFEARGGSVWISANSADRPPPDCLGPISVAIVDLMPTDPRSEVPLGWLAERGIPTVVIAPEENGPVDLPGIIGRLSKPIRVDDLPPRIEAWLHREVTPEAEPQSRTGSAG
ncbi:hypothetical protein HKCCE2091_00520 [Rhodobacterales bacterium HKCCE2091]|nr:hypothetical protein [Rhodobacterales bacterium HKCCE2091]